MISTHMWNIKKNTQTKSRNKIINAENKQWLPEGRGWGLGKMGEEEGEIEACHYGIDESGGERHSLGNRVNGIVTALCGGRGQVHMW